MFNPQMIASVRGPVTLGELGLPRIWDEYFPGGGGGFDTGGQWGGYNPGDLNPHGGGDVVVTNMLGCKLPLVKRGNVCVWPDGVVGQIIEDPAASLVPVGAVVPGEVQGVTPSALQSAADWVSNNLLLAGLGVAGGLVLLAIFSSRSR